MAANSAYETYKKTQVETANQGRLIVMLYEGAIKFTRAAIDCIKSKKVEQAHKNIVRAEDIITELLLSLDYDKGGDIAKKLASIYIYINQQLLEANITKKTEPMEMVVRILNDLKDSWEKISNKITDSDSKDMNKKGGLNISG